MNLPPESLKRHWDFDTLVSVVRNQRITGTLTYPNGKATPIEYEVVRHRDKDDIYMKTTLGYFLWEWVTIREDQLAFVIDWWYCPPARDLDRAALEMAIQLLADSANWHKEDDRRCDNDTETNCWSLFCALKHASLEKMGEYNHHNTAMQTVRFVIDDLIPDHRFEHTLMDFNNAPATTHADIIRALKLAEQRITQQLEKGQQRKPN
jgi:hypothetical protein